MKLFHKYDDVRGAGVTMELLRMQERGRGRFGETDLKRLRSNALIGDKNPVAKTWRGKK